MVAKKLWIVYQKSVTINYPTTALAALVEAGSVDDAINQAINVGSFNHDLEFYAMSIDGEPDLYKIGTTVKAKKA